MIKEPYIFLSRNYFKNSLDDNGNIKAENEILSDNDVSTTMLFEGTGTIQGAFADIYGRQEVRSFDKIIFLNTDIKLFRLYTRNSETGLYQEIGIFSLLENYAIIDLPSLLTTDAIRIEILEGTYLGELKVCKFILNKQLLALTNGNFGIESAADSYRTASGRLIHFKDYSKWKNSLSISNLAKDQFDILMAEIQDSAELTIIPYKGFDIKAIYECNVNPQVSYSVDRNSELVNVTLDCKEL